MPITHYPRIWFNFLCQPLRSWERAAIDAWLGEVDPETRNIVQSQVRLINLAQRSAAGKVVDLYYVQSGTKVGEFDRRLKWAAGRDEVLLGAVVLTVNGKQVECQLHAVNGRLFSLEFDRVPPLWLLRPNIDVGSVDVSMRPLKPEPKQLQAPLPSDYADVAQRSDALAANVSLLRPDEIYASTFEEGRFWLIAEISDVGMLGIRVEGDDKQVYLLHYDGRRPLGLGTSLRRALERARECE